MIPLTIPHPAAYYFLQSGEYRRAGEARSAHAGKKTESDAEFLASLVPSYLHLDYQGRVVRIDTFSKTICPGSRLGWTTCNPVFAERLERANESSTQAASGMSQALVGALLAEQWGYDGYLRWLKGARARVWAPSHFDLADRPSARRHQGRVPEPARLARRQPA